MKVVKLSMSGAFPPLIAFMVCTRATLPVTFTHKLTHCCVVSYIISVLNHLHSFHQSSIVFSASYLYSLQKNAHIA